MPIKTIFFDIDGTLLDFHKAELNGLNKLHLQYFSQIDKDYFFDIFKKVNRSVWIDLEEGRLSIDQLKVERFSRLLSALKTEGDAAKLAETYLIFLSETSEYLKGARELIESLKPNYRLGILTNGLTLVQKRRLKESGLTQICEAQVISEEVGVSKPNKAIFEILAKKLGCKLDDSVAILGDSLPSDIQGGINAGIKTIWYNPEKWENQSPYKADKVLYRLSDLTEILKEL